MTRVIDSVFLKQDGKTVEVMCHFPFNLRTRTIPIKDFFIPRSDDLARRLRRNEELIDTRCIPLVYEGKEYKLFIEGILHDKEVFNAVADKKEIDTSDSVNPITLESLIVDVQATNV